MNCNKFKISGLRVFKERRVRDSFTCHEGESNSFPSLDASRTALLIVDVQPEYWSKCPAVRKDFPDFPSRISSLIENCREKSVKRIIWVRASYNYEYSPWLHQFARLHKGRIPPVVELSSDWEGFATPLDDEIVITKTSWSSTSGGTGLIDILENDDIESVLVCGLITSVCVQHSAYGLFEAGFRTILVADACADRGMERHKAALFLYGDYMYELQTVDSLYSEFKQETTGKANTFWLNDCTIAKFGNSMVKSKSNGSLTSATSSDDSNSMSDEASFLYLATGAEYYLCSSSF